MSRNVARRVALIGAAVLVSELAIGAPRVRAQETVLTFDGDVPADGDYFVIPFDVPAGIAEIEVRHDDLSEANILDWGLLGPGGAFRGYGGGNVEPAVVSAQAASRSYLPGEIAAGAWAVYVGKAKIDETPARYHVEVVLRETATLAPMPERRPYAPVAALSSEARWYAGDFHVHSRESGDASPTLEEIAVVAERHGLDFVMLSEHNTTSQLELYAEVQAAHPALLFVPGIEVTTYAGHAMSMGGTTWIDHRLGFEGRTIAAVADDVHADGALFSINHPALTIGDACIGCGWMAELGAEDVDAIEVQTGAYSVTGLFFSRVIARWEDLIADGRHVVAVGGSDDHRAGTGTGAFDSPIGSPTTMVFAEELSAAAILEGVRRGRTVVRLEGPDDPMVEILEPDVAHGESDTIVADATTLRVRVTGAAMGATLTIVRDGRAGEEIEVVADPFEHEETLIAGAGESFVRAQLAIGGRPRVITSHVFLRPLTPGGPDAGPAEVDAGAGAMPEGGSCGCRAAGRRASGGIATAIVAIAIASALRRRRAR